MREIKGRSFDLRSPPLLSTSTRLMDEQGIMIIHKFCRIGNCEAIQISNQLAPAAALPPGSMEK